MKKLSKSKKNYMESIWQDHITILTQPDNVYYRAARSFQRRFDEITGNKEIQKRLNAAVMDAYRNDEDDGLPKYSKSVWLISGKVWGIEKEMKVYMEKYWSDYVTDSRKHLKHSEPITWEKDLK